MDLSIDPNQESELLLCRRRTGRRYVKVIDVNKESWNEHRDVEYRSDAFSGYDDISDVIASNVMANCVVRDEDPTSFTVNSEGEWCVPITPNFVYEHALTLTNRDEARTLAAKFKEGFFDAAEWETWNDLQECELVARKLQELQQQE